MESGKHTPPTNPMGRAVIPTGQQLGVSMEVLQGRCTLPKGREGDSPGGKGRGKDPHEGPAEQGHPLKVEHERLQGSREEGRILMRVLQGRGTSTGEGWGLYKQSHRARVRRAPCGHH